MTAGGASSAASSGQPPRHRTISPITRRILAVNVLALMILSGGLLYLGEYRRGLIQNELKALTIHAEMLAGAIGEGAVSVDPVLGYQLSKDQAVQIIRRLVETTQARARLFAPDSALITDSRLLRPGGMIQTEELPPPNPRRRALGEILDLYDEMVSFLIRREDLPRYEERWDQKAHDYDEVLHALAGETASMVRSFGDDRLLLSVAVPVTRYKQVLGSLMLARSSVSIDEAVLRVRVDILKVFLVALAVTILLSIYLAGTIARPIRRLAASAERVRRSHKREDAISGGEGRRDEIGDLARALREMTDALWHRIEAIERFAADVAHEIKNPLTSLQSAVETARRVKDPAQQQKLLTIIEHDVHRLDRLITDISNASRLDAELMRANPEPVDLRAMFETLVDTHMSTAPADGPRLVFEAPQHERLVVNGIEDRLVQVFRNLIANAVSFGPKGGTIRLTASREGSDRSAVVVVAIEDEGPGIPAGKEEAIFERFYSERPQGETYGNHSGLGLSISKLIVEVLGGTIKAENRTADDGRVLGARVVVRLPAA